MAYFVSDKQPARFRQLQKRNLQVQSFILQLIIERSCWELLSQLQEFTMTKFFTLALSTLLLSVTAAPAVAADAERNDRLYDADGSSVAKVSRVAEDGDVLVIYKGKLRRIQAETLSNQDGKLMTSMTRTEIRRMR